MRIETLPLAEVEDSYYNPRVPLQPGDPEYEQIKKSIQEYGLVEPLVYNIRTGRLVGGHQRKRVLQELGHVEAEFSVVDLDEDREKALNIALNRGGRWDDDGLASLLDEIRGTDAEMLAVTGYTPDEVDDLLRDMEARHSTDFLDDLTAPGTDVEQPASPAGTSAEEEHVRGSQYVQLSYAVTPEQKAIVVEAIRLKKEELDCDSIEALVAICEDVINGA